jgi:ABC-type enterochelin transport system substrate-binding protein
MTDANLEEMKADKAEMMAKMDSNQEMIARIMATQERTDANLEEMKATIRSSQEEMIKA